MQYDIQQWKFFVFALYGRTCKQILSSGATKSCLSNLSPFYNEIFHVAAEQLHPLNHELLNIKNEHLAFTENLKIAEKPITLNELEVKKVNDMINQNNNFLNANDISLLFNISLMTANSILSCVPKNWKKRIKQQASLNVNDSVYF